MIEQTIPTHANAIGSNIDSNEPKVVRPSTMVAMILPTYDSYKSAPIPATSHTLSPTLSAITAGFLGSSSGIPASTLPTKSAPTSAALVYIPHHTLANNAMDEAHSPKPVRMLVLISAGMFIVWNT